MGKINKNGYAEDTVYGNKTQETWPARDTEETVYAGGEETARTVEKEETVLAGEQKRQTIEEAEKSVAPDWNAGDVILGLYEVLPVDDTGRAYHAGGFGKVYRVRHKTWKAELAVKAPQAHAFADEAQKENFIRECEAWIALGTHPNIATCYYVRELGGVPRIFAEYVSGGSLKDWIRSGRLYEGGAEESLRRILDVSIQFARGLGYAHEQGMTHRDVKPQNVMMTPGGEAKMVDFGLARDMKAKNHVHPFMNPSVLHRGREKTAQGGKKEKEIGGYTPAYCSPEQAEGRPLGRGTDIWSFGVSVLEMFTGEAAWQSGTLAPYVLEAYLGGMAEKDEALPSMPESMAALLKECFAQDESGRPQSMQDVEGRLIAAYEEACGNDYPHRPAQGAADSADTLNNRALSYLDLGNGKKAEKMWEQALKADPYHAASIYNRGLMRWRKGALSDQALLHQLESVRENTDESQSRYLLGQVHMERGDAKSAVALLQEAAERSGGSGQVAAALQTAKKGQGKWSRCINTFNGGSKTLALSGDGRIAVGARGVQLHVYDPFTGEQKRAIKGHTSYIVSVDISEDGRLALSGGDRTVRLWDTATGECMQTLEGHPAGINFVSLSADGCWALSGTSPAFGEFSLINLWDIGTGKCFRKFEGDKNNLKCAVLSRDKRMVVSAEFVYEGGWIKVWDVGKGSCMREIQCPGVSRVALSADGRFILSDGWDQGYVIKWWELSSGRCLRTMHGHREPVTSLAIGEDGAFCLSAGEDAAVRLWDIRLGRCLRTFEGHTGKVSAAFLSAGAGYALSGDESSKLKLWALGLSGYVAPWQLSRPESSNEAFKRNEQFDAYMRNAKEALAREDASLAADILEKAKQMPGCTKRAAFHDAWAGLYAYLPKRRLDSVWALNSFLIPYGEIHCGAFSPDGMHAVLGGNSEVEMWDVFKSESIRMFKGHRREIVSVAFGMDAGVFLSGAHDGEIRLWNTGSGQCLRTMKDSYYIYGVALSNNGRMAASASRQLKLWDTGSGDCLQTFKGHADEAVSVYLSGDGRRVLSGSKDRMARLWDSQTGECLQTFKGHTGIVRSVSLSPDGRFALSGGMDKRVCIWDTATGECLHSFSGHTDSVDVVAFSPDGRFAVSGSRDKTLRLFDVRAGQCVHVFRESTNPVRFAGFSRDGRHLVSGGQKEVRVFELFFELEK